MKFPAIIKTNKFNSFHYEPRYYDPIKEEIQGKLKAAQNRVSNKNSDIGYTSNISIAFRKRVRANSTTSVVQMLIAATMLGTFIGWLFYGNYVFYVYLLLSPLYLYCRFKQKSQRD